MANLQDEFAGGQQLLIRSNSALRAEALEVFDRTFRITGVLRLLAGLVAFIGVLSALLALELERGRELAVLRATGLTRGQLWLEAPSLLDLVWPLPSSVESPQERFLREHSGWKYFPQRLGLLAVAVDPFRAAVIQLTTCRAGTYSFSKVSRCVEFSL